MRPRGTTPQRTARKTNPGDRAEDGGAEDGGAEDSGAKRTTQRTTKRARDSKTIAPLAVVLLVRHGEDDAVTTQTRIGQEGQTGGQVEAGKLESWKAGKLES